MKYLTTDDARLWCIDAGIEIASAEKRPIQLVGLAETRKFVLPSSVHTLTWLCKYFENSLRPWTRSLLWPTDWEIWPSSENWHLYYKLRQTYGDTRFLEDAPAHLFQQHEAADLVSFLQIAVASGWDFYLLSAENYLQIFVSHDEWLTVSAPSEAPIEAFSADFRKAAVGAIS